MILEETPGMSFPGFYFATNHSNWRAHTNMKLDDYNQFCAGLPSSSFVIQWGDAHVWKVAGKVFALARAADAASEVAVSFKCSPLSFAILLEQPGIRPAPYLASRGLTWVQRYSAEAIDDAALKEYLAESHRLVAAGLSKKLQIEIFGQK